MIGTQENVNNFVGVDISKKQLTIIRIIDNKKHQRFVTKTNKEGEKIFIKWLNATDTVVMEAGSQTFRLAKRIQKRGIKVIVLNPGDVASIYNSLKKTDKEDALKLARIAQRNPRKELPEVRIPSDEEEDIRRLSTEQSFWSKQSTCAKNRLHSLFTQAGLTDITKKHLSTHKNREEYVKLLPGRYLDEALRLVENLSNIDKNLSVIAGETRNKLKENSVYTSLAMSIPGIGPVATLAFLAYLGECDRFSSGKQVSYYAGLVPRVDQSGETVKYGKIIKRGTNPIRRVIVQCAWALVRSRYGGELKEFYERLYPRIGKKKAIVAVARKMVETFYAMINNGELYRGVTEEFLNNKLKLYGLV